MIPANGMNTLRILDSEVEYDMVNMWTERVYGKRFIHVLVSPACEFFYISEVLTQIQLVKEPLAL